MIILCIIYKPSVFPTLGACREFHQLSTNALHKICPRKDLPYHLIPVRMAVITRQEENVGKDVEKRRPLCTLGGHKMGGAPVENSMEVP